MSGRLIDGSKALSELVLILATRKDNHSAVLYDFEDSIKSGRLDAQSPTPGQDGQSMDSVCVWTQEREDDDFYETSCGNAFSLNDGTPEANGLKHCCYCGKALEQSLFRDSEAADAGIDPPSPTQPEKENES